MPAPSRPQQPVYSGSQLYVAGSPVGAAVATPGFDGGTGPTRMGLSRTAGEPPQEQTGSGRPNPIPRADCDSGEPRLIQLTDAGG
ncbi:MAG: hypothetical protein OXH50_14610, partial [Gemmatimonadetes bacterium]|nr:hypothetical protein [Gemmatimonadota bacterium]